MTKAESAGSVTQKTHFADDETLARMAALELEAADLRERLAKAEAALSDIAEGPQPFHQYLFGIRCGVEDRGLQGNVYEAAEYAYQAGIEYCQDVAASALSQKGADHE